MGPPGCIGWLARLQIPISTASGQSGYNSATPDRGRPGSGPQTTIPRPLSEAAGSSRIHLPSSAEAGSQPSSGAQASATVEREGREKVTRPLGIAFSATGDGITGKRCRNRR